MTKSDTFEGFASELAAVFKKEIASTLTKDHPPLEWISLVSERGQEEKLSLYRSWGEDSEGEKMRFKSEFLYVVDDAPESDDVDGDEFEEACDSVRKFGALVALGLVALELKENAKLIPAPRAKGFKIVVADDSETPDMAAEIPSFDWDVSDAALRKAVLDAIFGTSKTRAMFETLLKKPGKDLLTTLAKV